MNDAKVGRRELEHKKIIEYLQNNNGINLKLVEPNLVSCSNVKTKKSRFGELLNNDPIFKEKLPYIDFNFEEPYFTNCDLYCFNEKDGAFVVIEVKSEKADYQVFGQILYYLINAEVIECANGQKVKTLSGIILAKEIDKTLKILVNKYKNHIPYIKLKTYRWDSGKLVIKNI